MLSAVGSNVVLLERPARNVPPPARGPADAELRGLDPALDRPRRAVRPRGRVAARRPCRLRVQGDLRTGSSRWSSTTSARTASSSTAAARRSRRAAAASRHTADVRHVELDTEEEENVFYRADMHVDWRAGGHPPYGGTIELLALGRSCRGVGRDDVRSAGALEGRQPGAEAGAGRTALPPNEPRLADDHRRARMQVGREVRVHGVGEDLESVHEPRRGPREERRRVDGDDPLRAERGEPVVVVERLVRGAATSKPQGITTTTSGCGGDLLPARGARLLSGQPERVHAARELDQLRDPVPADVRRGEPLERRDGPRRRAVDAARAPRRSGRPRRRAARRPRPRPRSPRRAGARRPAPRRASSGRARSPAAATAISSAMARTSSIETAQTSHSAWVTIRSGSSSRSARCRARRGARRGSCARARPRRSPRVDRPSGMTVRVRCGSSAASGG